MPLRHSACGFWRLDDNAAADLAPLDAPFGDPRFLAALEGCGELWSVHRLGALSPDGARAALSLAHQGTEAMSVPFGYGGIAADRSLEAHEVDALLRLAGRHLDVRRVRSRYVPLPVNGRPAHAGGHVIASTAVFTISDPHVDVESRLAKKARQSIRRAERAGVVVSATSDPTAFLSGYADASKRFSMVYPARLIELLAASGLGRTYNAMVGDDVIASAFALAGHMEWMYWLAAQNETGRRAEAGYAVLARLLADARDAGARFVNLGASTGLPGVAKFKRRIGGVDLPVIEHDVALSHVPIRLHQLLTDQTVTRLVRRVRRAPQWRTARSR